MSYDVVIQLGHCFRRRDATGTAGHRGTEQAFVAKLGPMMVASLHDFGLTARTVLADEVIPSSTVFVALHQDGSSSKRAGGASIGYPPTNNEGRELGQLWKASYQKAGWSFGFRPDNYTRGLRYYYAFKYTNAKAKFLIEHGFATNVQEENWMWDQMHLIAHANAEAIARYLKGNLSPPLVELPDYNDEDEEDGMVTLIDSTTGEGWIASSTKARKLSDVGAWMSSWIGPTRKSANMRYVIPQLYEVV